MSRVLLATVGLALAVSTEGRDAGILYEVWHSSAANTYKKVKAAGGVQLTTELVVRSAGNLTLDDVFVKYGLNGDIFNVQPQLGFYCLYRARPGDPSPPLPDCDNITGTSTAHASMLTQAGFDYVAVDITNWPMNDTDGATDIAVLRPTEVLFEEWSALRAAGTPTPSIALWPCSPAGGTTWKYLLDTLYNDPVYGDLVYKQDGKKVMFIPYTGSCYDPATAALIESNGGRNDVVAIPVWALFGQQTYAQGVYGFFSPCTDATGAYTTSMVGGNVGPCNQFATTANGSNTILEVSASGGYMTSQCALPFASPGHMRGLTLSRLFQKVLATQAPHLFMSSFNEMIGGRQAPASPALIAFNMGLPKDSQRKSVWVDSYAAEFSRDIEPTVEGGSMVWNVAASCVQMYKAGQTCADAPTAPCCTTDDKLVFGNIWSLASTNGTDYLLTPYLEERTALVKSGAWREQCSPIPNPTAFCVDTSDPDGRAGPFILYNTSTAGDAIGIQVIPLYRCVTAASGQHFFSVDAACEGLGNQQTLLGYIATSPGRETLRALYRCKGQAQGSRHHALDLECDVPDGDGTALGYVR